MNCPYEDARKTLSAMIGLRPQVIEDISSISKAFACNHIISSAIHFFVSTQTSFDLTIAHWMWLFCQVSALWQDMHGLSSKISSCEMRTFSKRMWRDTASDELKITETVLSTRMAKDKTDGLMKFLRLIHPNATTNEIKSALVSFGNDILRIAFTNLPPILGVFIWPRNRCYFELPRKQWNF